ncbi:MAG TPA: hypothetical protein ENG42_03430 [Candidatus Aenigmarchaeota archaeon]|nr:MAG: hypothetical protein DRP03_02200 [Candidatus Aenigmarchaeota archaeon]HDD46503.1 hypothetical protein [Candidatus Aenigmarchaeota archaeon]
MVRVGSISEGKVEVEGKIYFSDLELYWDGRIKLIEKFYVVTPSDVLRLAKAGAEIIVIISVFGNVKIEESAMEIAKSKGIDVFIEDAKKGAKLFNAFVADNKRVVALIHTL